MTYPEKIIKFKEKSAIESFNNKTLIDELPFLMQITSGLPPGSTVSLNAQTLWCKFLDGDWFRPYGDFNQKQIYQMIDICENDLQIVSLIELLSAKKKLNK